ncbi:uncharacterized protein LOC106071619 isoform X1 [Biomphalaria glabrata]|uniref:Uncharacterized protein LOC106071619 isoform X1 n=1 Tax=Biomphalaria glabrata TaxID=6526 RepID=A0A9U8EGW4_BIOGL|nr:uncharacterized protein LOC106071619 isoform X1 [Biomphalaria glabrata]
MTVTLSNSNNQDDSLLKPLPFYVGSLLYTCAVFFFLIGSSSHLWVVMTSQPVDMSRDTKAHLVAHYGPWVACTHSGTCGSSLLLEGVDQKTVRLTQCLIVAASILYIFGFLIMSLQLARPTQCEKLWQKMEQLIIVEFVFPVAAITGSVMMLAMASVNRSVLVPRDQVMQTGSAFYKTLFAILLTVVGALFTVLNRYSIGTSSAAKYIYRLRRFRFFSGVTKDTQTATSLQDVVIRESELDGGDKRIVRKSEL